MPLIAMGVAMAATTAMSVIGGNKAAKAEREAILKKQYNMRVQQSFNAEKIKTDLNKAEMDFQQGLINRLEGYSKVRNVQLATITAQNRSVDSLQGIFASDDLNFEYDNEVAELNKEMADISINLAKTQSDMGIQSDIESGDMARSASKSAQAWGNAAAGVGLLTSFGSMSMKYSKGASTKNASFGDYFTMKKS